MVETGVIEKFVSEAAAKTAGDGQIEVVHVEIAGTKRDRIVRIFIDKPAGVTIDDCSSFSHAVEAMLDEADPIAGKYVLEVSSPGIERELYKLSDFVRFTGEAAKVKLKEAIDGQKTLTGTIVSVDGETIEIDDRTSGLKKFEFGNVAKANLKIDLAKEFGTK